MRLTDKGALVKKYKDAIIEKVDNVERDIETINTMEHNDEILVEYLKSKNLSLAIKEVNDRHTILAQVQKDYEVVQEEQKKEEQVVEKVEKELSAPVEEKKLYSIKFKATSTYENLSYLVNVMRERTIDYEQFK